MTDWGAGSRSFRGRLSRVRNEARLSNPVSRTVTTFLGFDADWCGFVRGPISERALFARVLSVVQFGAGSVRQLKIPRGQPRESSTLSSGISE